MRIDGAKLWKVGILVGAAAGLVSFQNCSSRGNEGSEDPNDILSSKMDFQYDATIDQIAYMSCSSLKDNIDTDTYFSIRAGAYRDAGLKLKEEFFQTYTKKTPERMVDLLKNSPLNSSTVMQLAVRQRGALNSLVTNSGAPKQGTDFANLLYGLGGAEMSSLLVKNGMDPDTGDLTMKRTKFMRMGNGLGAHMEGNLRFGDTESFAASLRDSYLSNGKAVLALTYAEAAPGTNSATDARSEMSAAPGRNGATDHVFGMSYALQFSIPTGARGFPEHNLDGTVKQPYKEVTRAPSSWMTMVQEGNLSDPANNTGARGWVCPANLRFRIMRSDLDLKDLAGNTLCLRKPDPDKATLAKDEALRVQLARNSLRVEDWYIDFTTKGANDGGCIIPKKNTGSCYGENNYVQYNYTVQAGCDPNSNKQTNTLKSQACLAWVSICYRQ